MAATDVLSSAMLASPPASNAASLEFRAGGSTDNEAFPVWAFDASSAEKLDLHGVMSSRYSGAGFKVRLPWVAASATTGGIRWAAAFRRLDTAEDVNTSHSYSEQAATSSAPGTSGYPGYAEIAFTQAQADSIAASEAFVLRIRRDVSHAGDNMTGDAQLLAHAVMMIET